jgi:hypothetical protein
MTTDEDLDALFYGRRKRIAAVVLPVLGVAVIVAMLVGALAWQYSLAQTCAARGGVVGRDFWNRPMCVPAQPVSP